MKYWCFLAFVSALLQGQDQPGVLLPKPDAGQLPVLGEKLFDWPPIQSQPEPNWFQALKQKRFDWRLTNTQPRTVFNLEAQPGESTCVVPLLVVPVNPNTDPKMLIVPPRSKSESAGIVKGLPPCRKQ